MSQRQRGGIVPLLLIIFVVGMYAGYALVTYSNAGRLGASTADLTARIGALEGRIAALQSQIEGLEQRNGTIQQASLNELYESVKPSIVIISGLVASSSIIGTTYDEVLGSGFVVNLTGTPLIVTNYHVIDGMINGSVTFIDGDAYPFQVLGKDKYSDLAVISVSAPPQKLIPLPVAPSSTLRVGDSVIAVGNPYGLQSTLTSGIVSQIGRAIQTATAGNYNIANVIQISTPINPGNSGGPLLDSFGRVVGITTAIITGSQNVGFAVPSDTLIREFVSLVTTGGYSHPYVGITGTSMDYLIARALNTSTTYGILVQSVTAGGPAEAAGIRGGNFTITVGSSQLKGGGDIIVKVDNTTVRVMDDFTSTLERYFPGQTVVLTVIRGGQPVEVPVTLGVRP
ncbi:MAG: trypsin-like peptidase domain-containing protein [Candidatus Methanomethylicia archaeon]|nr:trypsin-like peptidase domain-containing protein [Candidatus Methanomethylicia archaeon]